jgi:hypothetical protein
MKAGADQAQAVDAGTDHQKDMALAVDILKHLSVTHRSAFESRKKFEWKLFFAVPTFFVVVTAGVWNNTNLNHLIGQVSDTAVWITSGIIAVVTCALLYLLQLAHEVNKSAAHQAEEHLQRIYNESSGLATKFHAPPLDMFSKRSDVWVFENPARSLKAGPWGIMFQWLVVAVIAFGCAYLITVKLDRLNATGEPMTPVPTIIHAPK